MKRYCLRGCAWGKAVVETLARDLQNEFPGIQGFSSANLWRMRNFFLSTATVKNSRHWREKSAGRRM